MSNTISIDQVKSLFEARNLITNLNQEDAEVMNLPLELQKKFIDQMKDVDKAHEKLECRVQKALNLHKRILPYIEILKLKIARFNADHPDEEGGADE